MIKLKPKATCNHLILAKLADTVYAPFQSFKEGYRYYVCDECGETFKAMATAAHVVEEPK